jgi:hypothetical protein
MIELASKLERHFRSGHLGEGDGCADRCLAVAEEWLSLQQKERISAAELAAFRGRLESIQELGSAAYEL